MTVMGPLTVENPTTGRRKVKPLATFSQKSAIISQGSVATCLRCGGIHRDGLIVVNNNLLTVPSLSLALSAKAFCVSAELFAK